MRSAQPCPVKCLQPVNTGEHRRCRPRPLVIFFAILAALGILTVIPPWLPGWELRYRLYAAATPSPEQALTELVARVEKSTRAVQDVTMTIEIEQYNPQTKEKAVVTGRVQIKFPDILRLNYLSPDFVAGQVMVINRTAGELRVYLPVTHEVVVQDLKTLMSKQGLDVALGLDSLVGLPPASLFHLTYLGEDTRDGKTYHVVKAVPRSNAGALGWEKIWISAQELMTQRLEVYNQTGQLSYVLTVKDIKINSGLQPAALLSLPRDAKVITTGSGS